MQDSIGEFISGFLEKLNISEHMLPVITEIIFFVSIIVLCIIVYLVAKLLLVKVLTGLIMKSESNWDNVFLDNKVIHRLIYLIPGIIVYFSAPLLEAAGNYIEMLSLVYIIFMILAVVMGVLDALNTIYEGSYSAAKQRPIKGFLQIVKIVLFIIALVIAVSRLVNQSPIYLLSGIGAMSAITMLIFQDSIKGLVAGIQMASNDLVRIGDWIEMPKYGADGDVVDISLTVVKVENFDRTITTIPAYALVSDSFKNWRGMQASGGRRIKRAINIDMSSIGFCSDELIEKLGHVEFLREYLSERTEEIRRYNVDRAIDTTMPVNGRRLTNIGVFRVYIREYIKHHPGIHKNMIMMVRQLSPLKEGLPLEVYCFTNTTEWVRYESIQSDIFDHLLAAAVYFDIKVFQEPSGGDIRALGGH
ncbi:mechanosensitive ion channel [Candidatus Nomurabacteria bacterium]|nr:mechanosensitive ion channel [Candidatus Nomurabacteria bacterium]